MQFIVENVEKNLAQRGLSKSTIGRDALVNAIIQSALPIAQSNATALQQRAAQQLNNQQQAQVLTRLIPELALGRNITQNPYHHLNVLEHNLACLTILEKLYTILSNNLKKIAPNLKTYLKKNNLSYNSMNL